MTSYREEDIASVNFVVQVHHPWFLESVGALESARLLGRPPVEWLQVMDHRDTLYATLQLQRDLKPNGASSVCRCITPHVDGGPQLRLWLRVLPFACAGTPRVSGVD